MRRTVLIACAFATAWLSCPAAQTPTTKPDQPRADQAAARPPAARESAKLPVRRVVLYKNGVGYFEHVGKVHGNESVAIDFNSSQLNDVLKSLTTLDLGNGRVTGVSYNTDAPFAERLGSLRLPVTERATRAELLNALRGARVEIHAPGGITSGRLLGIEPRQVGKGDTQTWADDLTIVNDAGEIRTFELTPAVTVKLAERETTEQVSAYMSLLATTRQQDRRRMSIATSGTGERDLLVSYVSEVPMWKTTYRIVLPSRAGAKPILQGWAIVDNTIGEDWTNVELSLVAGAPQSFIQQISQPLYLRRPVVPLPTTAMTTPQTHMATLVPGSGRVYGRAVDAQGEPLPGASIRAIDANGRTAATTVADDQGNYSFQGLQAGRYQLQFDLAGFNSYRTGDVIVSPTTDAEQNARMDVGSLAENVVVSKAAPAQRSARMSGVAGGFAAAPAPPPPPAAPMMRADMAAQQAAPAAEARELGDLFEYRVSQPITIARNQSALVPILRSEVAVERVSLWSGRTGGRPLRALWLTNTSTLTLDGASFTVLDGDAFAGEGLIETMKPNEKRLLSYAVDLGVQVEAKNGDERRTVNRVTIARGILVQHGEQVVRRVYTIRNSDTTDRRVVVEHPIRPGWKIADDVKPAETSADAYRFAVAVSAGKTETLTVTERQELGTTYQVGTINDQQLAAIVRDSGNGQAVRDALAPIVAKKGAVAAIAGDIATREQELERIDQDQQRVRENMKALKGTSEEQQLVKRYATQLNQQEDRVAALRREIDDLQKKRQAAEAELAAAIQALTLDARVGT